LVDLVYPVYFKLYLGERRRGEKEKKKEKRPACLSRGLLYDPSSRFAQGVGDVMH